MALTWQTIQIPMNKTFNFSYIQKSIALAHLLLASNIRIIRLCNTLLANTLEQIITHQNLLPAMPRSIQITLVQITQKNLLPAANIPQSDHTQSIIVMNEMGASVRHATVITAAL